MRHRPLTRLVLALAGAGALAVPADASAQAPPPGMGQNFPGADAFSIRYFLSGSDGSLGRAMAGLEFTQFYNRARCECGQQIYAQVRLKATMSGYNQGTPVDTMVGTSCATAEQTQVGQFRPCAVIKSAVLSDYIKGVTAGFHPVWLSNGVDRSSTDRNPDTAPASGSCEINQGEGGVWMCAQTNAMGGCQSDEFFIQGTQNINIGMGGIKYDFVPPRAEITSIDALPGDSAILLSWTLSSAGDIHGFRVLCEEADTGQPAYATAPSRPALNTPPNGTFYYTKDLLCPNGPFSTVLFGDGNDTAGDETTDGTSTTTDDTSGETSGGVFLEFASTGSTSDASTGGTSGATTGSTSDASTGGTGGETVCGNGVVEGDENCDDGNADDTDGCLSTCLFNASQGMRDLKWDYVCSGHISYTTSTVRIEGLENGKNYNFLLVAYDLFGNPKAVDKIVRAAPVETYDLWEQCAADGGVCGESGFCNVGNDTGGLTAVSAITVLGLGGIGVARRRRNRA